MLGLRGTIVAQVILINGDDFTSNSGRESVWTRKFGLPYAPEEEDVPCAQLEQCISILFDGVPCDSREPRNFGNHLGVLLLYTIKTRRRGICNAFNQFR